MDAPASRLPFTRIVLSNAAAMSLLCLALATAVEALRRWAAVAWADRAAQTVDAMLAAALQRVGAMDPLRLAYLEGRLTEFSIRLCYGATLVGLVLTISIATGSSLWALQALYRRVAA